MKLFQRKLSVIQPAINEKDEMSVESIEEFKGIGPSEVEVDDLR